MSTTIKLKELNLPMNDHNLQIMAIKNNKAVSCLSTNVVYSNWLKKGDRIKFDYLGNGTSGKGTADWTVLKVDKNIVTLLGYQIERTGSIKYWDGTPVLAEFDDGNEYITYENSNIDTALNTTLYNLFADNVKNAIIPINRVISCYSSSDSKLNTPDLEAAFNYGWPATNTYKSYYRVTQKTIGERYCCALDIDDIVEYFELETGDVLDGKDLMYFISRETTPHYPSNTAYNLAGAFVNTKYPTSKYVAGIYSGNPNSQYPGYSVDVGVTGGYLNYSPIIKIDLTNIEFTKVE